MAKKKRALSKSTRMGMITITFVVLLFLVAMSFKSYKLKEQNTQYISQKEELEQQIQDEELRSGEIENLKEYVNSTEYIEKVARDKLGLVYSDEILFQAEG